MDNIIHFIGDEYTTYSDLYKKFNNFDIQTQIDFTNLHSEIIYHIFDDMKQYIRLNLDNLDLSKFNKELLEFFIPSKKYLELYVLENMNIQQDMINKIYEKIKLFVK